MTFTIGGKLTNPVIHDCYSFINKEERTNEHVNVEYRVELKSPWKFITKIVVSRGLLICLVISENRFIDLDVLDNTLHVVFQSFITWQYTLPIWSFAYSIRIYKERFFCQCAMVELWTSFSCTLKKFAKKNSFVIESIEASLTLGIVHIFQSLTHISNYYLLELLNRAQDHDQNFKTKTFLYLRCRNWHHLENQDKTRAKKWIT